MKIKSLPSRLAKLVALAALLASHSFAANTQIDVNNGSTDLTVGATYTPSVAPGPTTDVTFTNITYSPTTFTVGANMTLDSVNVLNNTQSLIITNNTANATLTLTSAAGGNVVAPVQTTPVGAATDLIYVADSGNLTIQNGASTLGVALGSAGNFNVGGSLAISSILSGNFSLTKTGSGTLLLSGANTFGNATTTFTIGAGTVQLGAATLSLGAAANKVSVTNGADLDLNGKVFTTANALTINGQFSPTVGALTNSSATAGSYAGTVAMASDSSIGGNNGDITVGSVVSGNFNLTKVGSDTLILGNTGNTFGSATTTFTIGAGTVKLNAVTLSLGVAGNKVSVTSGAVLDVNGKAYTTLNALTLNGSGIGGTGALIDGISTAGSYAGAVNLASASTIGNAGTTLFTVGGSVTSTGTADLTLRPAGTGGITLTNVNNTGRIIDAGTGNGTVTVTTMGSNVTGVTQNSTTSPLTLTTVTLGSSQSWTNNGTTFTDNGVVTGGANTLTLDGTGNGLTTLTGGLNFSGAGGLIIGKSGTLGTTISGGTITLGGTGGLTINSGASAVSLGAATVSAAQSWTNSSSTSMVQTGVLALGANTLTLAGGNFTFSQTNTGTGSIALNAGNLIATVAGAFGPSTETLTFGGGNLDLRATTNAAVTYTGALNLNSTAETISVNTAAATNGLTHTISGALTLGTETTTVSAGSNINTNTAYGLTLSGNKTFSAAGSNATFTINGNGSGNGTLSLITGTINTGGNTQTLTFNTGTGTGVNSAVLSGNFTGTAGTLVLAGNAPVTVGALTGATADAVRVNGSGKYTFNGASTFTGGVTLTAGTLNINSAGVAGTSGALGNGGTFTINGGTIDNTTAAAIIVLNNNSMTINGDFVFTGTQNLTLPGAISLGTTAGPSRTITGNAGTLTLPGNISDGTNGTPANSIIKAGNGTVILSGANAYTGTTTVSAGMLEFYNLNSLYGGTTTSWTNTNIDVKSGGTLAVGFNGTGQFSSANIDTLRSQLSAASGGFEAGARLGIDTTGGNTTANLYASSITDTAAGALGVTKFGANPLTLSGTNTYTGVTTVSGGILNAVLTDGLLPSNIGASSNAASNLVVINGGNLHSDFTTDRLFSLGGNSTANIGRDGGTQTWYNTGAIGFIDSNSSNTLRFNDIAGGGAYEPAHEYFSPQIVDNGTGKTSVNTGSGKSNSAGAANMGLVLINANNSYTGNTTVSGAVNVYKMSNGGANSSIGASSSAASNLVFGGSWSYFTYLGSGDSTDRNYTFGAMPLAFDSSGTGALQMTGTATYTAINVARSLTFNGTNTNANSYGGLLVDNGTGLLAVTKNGTGFWTLANAANTYTGMTRISGGILSVGALANGGIASSIGASSNATTNLVIGGGALQYTGAAQNTDRLFTITLGGATLEASGASDAALSFTNTGIQSPDAASQTGTTAVNKVITGLTSTTGLYVGMAVAGSTILPGATIASIDSATQITLTVSANNTVGTPTVSFGYGARTLTLSGASAGANSIAGILQDSATVGGTLGTLGVTKAGAGTWTLPGTNTYTGVTTISGGILSVGALANGGNNSNIGASTSAATNLRFSGGTLQYTGAAQNTDRLFTIAPGDATIDASGASNAALSFTNTGILSPDVASRLGSTATNVLTVGSTADLFVGMAVSGNGTAAGTTITAITSATTATLSSAPGTHASNTITFGYGTRTLNLTGSSTGSIAGILQDGATVGGTLGTLGVTKNGTGTWALTGNNTYNGTTTITTGTLLINGSTASGSAVSLGAAVLGGSGTVGGTVTTAGMTSVISPGTATPGTLTLGALDARNGGDFVFRLGTSSDVLTITSLLTGSTETGGLQFDFSNLSGFAVGNPYTVINFGSAPGLTYSMFAGNAPTGFVMDTGFGTNGFLINGSNLQVQFTAVPEPQTWALLAAGLTVVVTFRRRRR